MRSRRGASISTFFPSLLSYSHLHGQPLGEATPLLAELVPLVLRQEGKERFFLQFLLLLLATERGRRQRVDAGERRRRSSSRICRRSCSCCSLCSCRCLSSPYCDDVGAIAFFLHLEETKRRRRRERSGFEPRDEEKEGENVKGTPPLSGRLRSPRERCPSPPVSPPPLSLSLTARKPLLYSSSSSNSPCTNTRRSSCPVRLFLLSTVAQRQATALSPALLAVSARSPGEKK